MSDVREMLDEILDNINGEIYTAMALVEIDKYYDALDAVLAIPKHSLEIFSSERDRRFAEGSNQSLDEVREAIEGKLGAV